MANASAAIESGEVILLLDASSERSRALLGAFNSLGLSLRHAGSLEEAVVHGAAVVLIPAAKGNQILSILRELHGMFSRPEVIVFGCGDSGMSVTDSCRCLLEGARHLVEGADPSILSSKIKRCLEYRREMQIETCTHTNFPTSELGVIYGSDRMHQMLRKLRKVAEVKNATVLLTGPTGSGKQKLAESIHRMDPWRRNAPMITLNCATIPVPLAESELFGHRRGSYTGATADRMGCFRAANGGTLVLDEIGELDLSLQPKLLRTLEEHKVRSLGQDSEVPVDVRIIATTNRDLRSMVVDGRFRMDLYQRLAMVELFIPPLAHRPEDIPPLMNFFIDKHRELYDGYIREIHPNVIDVLSRYAFDGNVRELENLVRYVLFNKNHGDAIQVEDLPRHVLEGIVSMTKRVTHEAASGYLSSRVFHDKMSLSEVLNECESIMVKAALDFTRGNRSAAADLLKISERTLYNKLHHCGPTMPRNPAESAVTVSEPVA
jgi:transcriptional regulator with PAS, ATPase and Fis domain